MSIVFYIILLGFCIFFVSVVSGKLDKIFLALVAGIWIITMGISLLNPFGLYSVSNEVYLIVSIGTLSYVFGYSVLNIKIKRKKTHINIITEIKFLINNKYIKYTFLVAFSILMFLGITQWTLITMQGGMGNLKVDFFELIFNNNSGLYFIYQVVLVPFFYFSCSILAFALLNGSFNKKLLLIFIYIILFSYIGGKRGYFSIFLQYFVITYFICKYIKGKNRKILTKKMLGSLALIGAISVSGAAYMTTVGKNGSQFEEEDFKDSVVEIIENSVIYQIGPYRALDYALEHDYLEKYGAYTYGRSSFGGMLDYYGVGSLRFIGLKLKSAREYSMSPLQENSIPVGENRTWNFSYTSFYYFLFDFGYLGIIIVPIIFGLFTRFIIHLFKIRRTVGLLCLLGYLFIACILFHASWFNVSLYSQPIIFISLFCSYMETKHRNKDMFPKKFSLCRIQDFY